MAPSSLAVVVASFLELAEAEPDTRLFVIGLRGTRGGGSGQDIGGQVEPVLRTVQRPVLLAQRRKVRGEAIAEMKADGIEYEERMRLLDEITWPRPLAEELAAQAPQMFEVTRQCMSYFHELFGKAFLQAYEEQMARLKSDA